MRGTDRRCPLHTNRLERIGGKKLNLEKTLWTSGLVFLVRYIGDVAVGFILLLIELGLNDAIAYMTH